MGEMSRPHARSLLSMAALLVALVLIGSVFDAKQLAESRARAHFLKQTYPYRTRRELPKLRARQGRLYGDKCSGGAALTHLCVLFLSALPPRLSVSTRKHQFRRMSFMPILISGVIKSAGRTGRFAWHLFVPTRLMSFLL